MFRHERSLTPPSSDEAPPPTRSPSSAESTPLPAALGSPIIPLSLPPAPPVQRGHLHAPTITHMVLLRGDEPCMTPLMSRAVLPTNPNLAFRSRPPSPRKRSRNNVDWGNFGPHAPAPAPEVTLPPCFTLIPACQDTPQYECDP